MASANPPSHSPTAMLRRPLVEAILARRADALVITGLGTTCYDVFSAGDNPLNFYNWAGMGGAAMVACGLALAQPKRRVLCITGDGEMLMGLGSLATIACEKPKLAMLLPSICKSTTSQPPVGTLMLSGALNGMRSDVPGASHGCGNDEPGSGRYVNTPS